jgi:arginine deiminase
MEHFYYTAIYQALNAPNDHAKKMTTLKHLKAKITRLHSQQQQWILLDNGDSDRLIGEEVSLHHHITALKQKKARTVTQIQNGEVIIQTMSMAILRTFTDHLRQKYDHIPSSAESTRKRWTAALRNCHQ